MRELADSTRIEQFMRKLGRAARIESHVYLTGGDVDAPAEQMPAKGRGRRDSAKQAVRVRG